MLDKIDDGVQNQPSSAWFMRDDVNPDDVVIQVCRDPKVVALEAEGSEGLVEHGLAATLLHGIADEALEEVVGQKGRAKVKPEPSETRLAGGLALWEEAWHQEGLWLHFAGERHLLHEAQQEGLVSRLLVAVLPKAI